MTGFTLRDPIDLGLGQTPGDSRQLLLLTPDSFNDWMEGRDADNR